MVEVKSGTGAQPIGGRATEESGWGHYKLRTDVLTTHLPLDPPAAEIASVILRRDGRYTQLAAIKALPYTPGKLTHFKLSSDGGIELNSHLTSLDLLHIFYKERSE